MADRAYGVSHVGSLVLLYPWPVSLSLSLSRPLRPPSPSPFDPARAGLDVIGLQGDKRSQSLHPQGSWFAVYNLQIACWSVHPVAAGAHRFEAPDLIGEYGGRFRTSHDLNPQAQGP
ncbi:hypothetical protein BZA05DRAFT_82346 [Tricharina praecox]|uniref:uncharacterized protein n=1 Tax=Tricharina praecox TaxID=43433 RepID=UPI00221EB700|nr:uncharacterized protein BZA05DRAFT_82346 [Tricharina praecox]KAI5849075.1 hypothetical protein BZA05DRAFT_82346 [Tricharina praecox]